MPHTPAPQASAHLGAQRQATLTIKASFWQETAQKVRPLGATAYRRLRPVALFAALLIGFGTACAQSSAAVQPELPSARVQKAAFQSNTFAVAAANPLATQAGYEILRAGGSAVDAAIAVQMVLGVVEPQSSGIGGGGFLLHFDGKKAQAFDGREAAPSAARPHLFLDANGAPMPFEQAAIGGRAVGIPGLVRMLTMAQQQHGRLGWAKLFAPAIRIATEGFPISERMATLLAADKWLRLDPVASAYFYDRQGKPWPQGHVLTNPELAAVLTRIASEGSNALMLGELPQRMADVVRKHSTNPGTLAPLECRTTARSCASRCALTTPCLHISGNTASAACHRQAPGNWLSAKFWVPCGPWASCPRHCKTVSPRPIGCTATPKRHAWPWPTGSCMSATRALWCRPAAVGRACWSPLTWPSAPA